MIDLLQENWQQLGGQQELIERITALELELENRDWVRIDDLYQGNNQLSLRAIKMIAREARLFFLQNPLINRGTQVTSDYTFGRGISINARDEEINTVIQQFIDDKQNQKEITSHPAMLLKDRELQCDGNLFLLFFVHTGTGRVRVRTIPLDEIDSIICDKEDRKTPQYYKRVYNNSENKPETKYYRDWQLDNDVPDAPNAEDDCYVMHIKTGAFSDWKFGVCEFYSTHKWARAYNKFLSNWSVLMEAYARFAMVINTEGGSRGVQAVKEKIQTTISATGGDGIERNPPPAVGSTAVMDKRMALDVVKTAGATTKAEEGRRLELMVCAGLGLGEHMLGDVSVGTLATAESLDRPTELKFSNRQEMWQSIDKAICQFVIKHAVLAPNGPLASLATIVTNEYGEQEIIFGTGIDTRLTIKFPEIISLNVKDQIAAVVTMATLDGKTIQFFDARFIVEQLLQSLGVDDIDEILDSMFADGVQPVQEGLQIVEAVKFLTEAMVKYANDR